jgi:acetyltransferase-like isoleucine patch superfamily enzyme
LLRAYMLTSNKTIEPFGDHPRDCLILNRKLSELQEDVLQSLGCVLVPVPDVSMIKDPEEHIIFVDSLYFNNTLLTTFLAESRRLNKRTVCSLKSGLLTLRTIVNTQDVKINNDSVEYGLYYVPAGSSTGELVPVVMNPDKFYEDIPMPVHMFGLPSYRIPLPDKVAVQIDHWVNLWSVNLASLLAGISEIKGASKLKLLGLAARSFSTNQWKILAKTNCIGRNCDIHPTAYIEGSTLGDNVRVGAGTVIRESHIGSNCNIENCVTINFSVVGENCYLGDGAVVRYSVLYPGGFIITSTLSCSIMGRDSFKGGLVTMTDFRFDGRPIQVLKNGVIIDTGNTFIGSCLGHNSYLGAGVIVASGRSIPNGARLVPDNSRMISKFDANGSAPGFQRIYVKEVEE